MSQKLVNLNGVGEVIIQKRSGSKSVRISINNEGTVKVTIPKWSPYSVGESFVSNKLDWIAKHKATRKQHIFNNSERIGKAHRISFVNMHISKISTRVTSTQIIVKLPITIEYNSNSAQSALKKAAIKALKQEANNLLPKRLKDLAITNNFTYNSVNIKLLKTRWGSCNSDKDIILNCYLMQLPWDLIDYVLLHELMHTKIMAHGKIFWNELENHVSNLSHKRKTMRSHNPYLRPQL